MNGELESQPINLAHVQAGAPIRTRNEDAAEFVAFVKNAIKSEQLVVMVQGRIETRFETGLHYDDHYSLNDVVMAPLGWVDAKPVYTGDHLVPISDPSTDQKFYAGPKDRGPFTGWRWPEPELTMVYPVTACPVDVLAMKHNSYQTFSKSLQAVANAAIKHAIDSGQVVLPGDRDARDRIVAVMVRRACADVICSTEARNKIMRINLAPIVEKIST